MLKFRFEKVDRPSVNKAGRVTVKSYYLLTDSRCPIAPWIRTSRTKAEIKFLKELHDWLEGDTEFTLIARKDK